MHQLLPKQFRKTDGDLTVAEGVWIVRVGHTCGDFGNWKAGLDPRWRD